MALFTLILMKTLLGHLLLCLSFATEAALPQLNVDRDDELLSVTAAAVADLLKTTTKTWCTVVLVTDGRTLPFSVKKVAKATDLGCGIRFVEHERRNSNETRVHLTSVINDITKLRRTHKCLSVVVSSSDEDFLDDFASVYDTNILWVWERRPIFVTDLPIDQLRHLVQKNWNLFSGGAMAIHVLVSTTSKIARLSVYTHLNLSTNNDSQMAHVATWTPLRGLVSTSPVEFTERLCCGGTLSLKEALKDPYVYGEILKRPRTFRFSQPVTAVVGAEQWSTYIILRKIGDNEFHISGPMSSLLDALANSINFTYRLLQPLDHQWGSLNPDGTWTGMVGLVHTHKADFALGPHDVTEVRSKWIDFTVPLYFDARKFIVAQNRAEVDPWGFMFPLSSLVWMGILLSGGVVAVTTVVVVQKYKNNTWPDHIMAITFHTYRLLLQQGITMKLFKTSERLLILSWIIGAMILYWSYGMNLISLLAVRFAPKPIQTIRDLLEHDTMTVIFPHRTALSDYLFSVEKGQLKEVADLSKIGRYTEVPYTEFPRALEDMVRRGDHVLATDTVDSTRMIANFFSKTGKCQFYGARETFIPFTMGMVCQKRSPIVAVLNHRIQRIIEGGLHSYWLENHLPNSTACQHIPSSYTVMESLAMKNLWGIFVFLVSGLILASFLFIIEVIIDITSDDKAAGDSSS